MALSIDKNRHLALGQGESGSGELGIRANERLSSGPDAGQVLAGRQALRAGEVVNEELKIAVEACNV